MLSIIIAIVISPFLAILLYLYMKYRFSSGYFGLLIRSYFWGILSSIFAGIIIYGAYSQGYLDLKNLRRIIFYSFFIIGFGQEIGKFLVLRYLILPSKVFNDPADGILYSLMISFGAATVFNIAAIFLFPSYDANILIGNVLVSIVFAVVMGFFVGMGKLRNNRMIDSLSGLFGAAFFHGSYEFILETNDKLLFWPFLIGSALITFLLIVKSIQISDDNK